MPYLLYWLEKEADRLHMAFNRDEWSFEMLPHCPRQTDSVDCGIMMLTGMLFTCDDLQLTYNQAQMVLYRTRWAADLLDLMNSIGFIISVLVTQSTGASVQLPVGGTSVAPPYEPHSLRECLNEA
jgi:hypothetical protein